MIGLSSVHNQGTVLDSNEVNQEPFPSLVISDSSSEIGVVSELVSDGGLWAVSAVGCGVCGQVGYDSGEAFHELFPASAVEVGPAHAHAEEGVAGEDHLLRFAVEADAARCVARRGKDGELMCSEGDDFSGFQQVACGWYLPLVVYSHH